MKLGLQVSQMALLELVAVRQLLLQVCRWRIKENFKAMSTSAKDQKGRGYVSSGGVSFVVRPLVLEDLPQLVDLRREGLSVDCAPSFHSWLETDPHGIQVAVTAEGEIAASCSIVKNGDEGDMAFGGLYCVKEKFQAQGIGWKIFTTCQKYTGELSVGCNAAIALHEKFLKYGAYDIRETRFSIVKYISASWPPHFAFLRADPPPRVRILPLHAASHLRAIIAYDENIANFRRSRQICLNVMEAGSRTLVALGGGDDGGALVGFGTAKKTVLGAVRVGPLYANDPRVAEALLRRLVEGPGRKGFAMVTTSANSVANGWMERLGVEVKEEHIRLYRKNAPDLNIDKVFALSDFSFSVI